MRGGLQPSPFDRSASFWGFPLFGPLPDRCDGVNAVYSGHGRLPGCQSATPAQLWPLLISKKPILNRKLKPNCPHVRIGIFFGDHFTPVRRDGPAWRVEAGENSRSAPVVVVATGWADYPHAPTWPGIETFGGAVMHSSAYRNPAPLAGKRVLVVGYGNSGAEIALDLAEAGIDVTLSVHSPVNVIPRELFGIPILVFPIVEQWLSPRLADAINAPLLRFAIGAIEKLGLKRSAKGPLQAIEEDGRVPLIDIGTLDAIRDGRIKLRGDVASFARESVVFKQSPAERFEAIILATGFRPDLRPLLPDAQGVLNATGAPLVSG